MATEGTTVIASEPGANGDNISNVTDDADNEIHNVTDDAENQGENENDKEEAKEEVKETNNDNKDEKSDEQNRKEEKNAKTVTLNINTIYIIAAVVFVIVGVVLYKLASDVKPERIGSNNYSCPDSHMYIPANGKRYDIDAFTSATTPEANVQCKWNYNNAKKPKKLLVTDTDTCKLKLRNTFSTGQFNVKLVVKFEDNNIMCPVKLIFHTVPYFGIDLGTTFSSISYQKAETDANDKRKYEIVVLDGNSYSIPTAIYFPPNNEDSILIGQSALDKRFDYPENVIYDIKRIIGRRASDNIDIIKQFNNTHSFNIDIDINKKIVIKIPKYIYNNNQKHIDTSYEYFYPEETLSPILAYLVHKASKKFNVPYIKDIVISVPAYFNNNQRKAIKNSCKIAGLNPVQLVVEPTAAALSHAYYSLLPSNAFDLFMVFDYGGGTLDCSILQCYNQQTCEVFHVGGDSLLGGIDYDLVIVDIMKKKFKQLHDWTDQHFTPERNAKLLLEAEKVKLELTTQHESNPIYMSNGIKTDSIKITRHEFENNQRTQQLLTKAIQSAKQTIYQDKDHTEQNLKMVLMVGGTSQIPIIKTKLEQAFSTISVPDPDKECELTVVKGTSVIGGELAFGKGGILRADRKNKPNTIDVTPFSLGFAVCNGPYGEPGVTCDNMNIVVEYGQRYPIKRHMEYYSSTESAVLELYEGNNPKVTDNFFLSEITISGFTKEVDRCDVVFQIDENGIVEINATVQDKVFVMEDFSVSNEYSLNNEQIEGLRHKMAKYDFLPFEVQKILAE